MPEDNHNSRDQDIPEKHEESFSEEIEGAKLKQFDKDRISRRQALSRIGITFTAVSAGFILSDDFAQAVINRVKQWHSEHEIILALDNDLTQSSRALFAGTSSNTSFLSSVAGTGSSQISKGSNSSIGSNSSRSSAGSIAPISSSKSSKSSKSSASTSGCCSDCSRWFIAGRPVRMENLATELIDGPVTFNAMVNAIRTANRRGHFIYLLGWWLTDSFQLLGPGSRGTSIHQLFRAASRAGVEVRSMLWDQWGTQNTAEVNHINALANGAAILDNRTLNFGSHHQKVLIVYGDQGLIAFCGGIDINEDRIAVLKRQAGSPMHDVHSQIQGPAAWDLLQIFVQRWFDHPDTRTLNPPAKRGLLGRALPLPPPMGPHIVQVGRTYGNGAAHAGIGGNAITGYTGYAFAPFGEQTARRMFLKGIATANRFIYIEDQYLVELRAAAALAAALPRLNHLTILIPATTITDLPQCGFRRRAFVRILRAADVTGKKVRIFELKPPGARHTYVHAKTWVFDDCYAIIGSANCNRRSWTHDSEAIVGICDTTPCPAIGLPQRLRMNLWAEHLAVNPAAVIDGVKSANLWLTPPAGARIAPFNENANIEWVHTDTAWDQEDPDGS